MIEKVYSYIGVTGVTDRRQVEDMLENMHELVGHQRSLMVGVLASAKQLRGIPLAERWARQYPTEIDEIARIFSPSQQCLNLVHFDTRPEYLSELYDDLVEIMNRGGPNLHGFQLNITWPDRDVLARLRDLPRASKLRIVLRVGEEALQALGDGVCEVDRPEALLRKVREYQGLVDYILFDLSGGKGIPIDPGRALDYLQPLERARRTGLMSAKLGVAGGLDHDTICRIAPIVIEIPDISIDAQGRLRNDRNELDLDACGMYIRGALALFAACSKE